MAPATLPPPTAAQAAELHKLIGVKWQTTTESEVLERFGSRATGLTAAEVLASRARYGPNFSPTAPPPTLLQRIGNQLNNTLMYILIGALIIAGVFKDWADFGLILAVIVLNVCIGVIQEGKAESAAAALQSMLSPKSMVVRDGRQVVVETVELVVGDVLYLQAGDFLGADVRFISISSLRCLESALTGEAEPVDKSLAVAPADRGIGDWSCCGFAGTSCVAGQGTGVVVGVGRATQIGAIRSMIESTTATVTPLQHSLEVFGRVVSILTILVAFVTFCIAYWGRQYELDTAFLTAIGVAVAMIPEGLPAIVTITLALGVREMASHNAIIRSLPAVETLGAVSVVCSDKTGTLTLNQMMVTRVRSRAAQYVVDGAGYDPFSGDAQGADGALRTSDPAALARLHWLTLPAVLANDGGLAPPSSNPHALRTPTLPPAAEDDKAVPAPGTAAAAAAREWHIAGDPTDVAALVLGMKAGVEGDVNAFKAAFPLLAKIPFDSEYKFQAQMHDIRDAPDGVPRRVVYGKGAWDVLIARCATQAAGGDAWASEPIEREWWRARASEYASSGLRVLAVVQWTVPADKTTLKLAELLTDAAETPCLQLNCLLAIVDPCRESAGRAVRECQHAGINVKMITGDHADTACFIARELGVLDEANFARYLAIKDGKSVEDVEARRRIVLQGADIEAIPKDAPGTALPVEAQLARYVLGVNVYARVSPEHKLRIVRALKNSHHRITSMTGDGVNDAPALKEAHVGVAMGITGTDVAKSAAKVILADDLFITIVTAVRLGRGVFDK